MRWPFQRNKLMEEPLTSPMTEAELKEKVVKAIKTVYDPEIPVDVYELGLIYEIKIFTYFSKHLKIIITNIWIIDIIDENVIILPNLFLCYQNLFICQNIWY